MSNAFPGSTTQAAGVSKKPNRQARRDARVKDFKAQKINSAKDFNFNQHGDNHVSGHEVRHLRGRHGEGGGNVRDTYAALQAQQEAGATFGTKAQKQFDRMGERIERIDARKEAKERAQQHQETSTTPTQPEQGVTTQPAVQPSTPGVNNNQEQNVNQDNDQTSTVTGDNNYIHQTQDNSIRNYGGDNRSFVYNAGDGEGPDTPATMATLAGYFAPDDSPAAIAKRLDQNVTMNRDNQKAYANTSHIAQGAISRAEQNSYINPAALDERIAARSQYHTDRATIQGANIFGDLYGLEGPDWNSAKPAKPVEKPDFEDMHDTYTDF